MLSSRACIFVITSLVHLILKCEAAIPKVECVNEVDNLTESLQKLPNVRGNFFSLYYVSDTGEVYLRSKRSWKLMAQEEAVKEKFLKLRHETQASQNKLEKKLVESELKISELSDKFLKLEERENKVYSSCKNAMETISNVNHGIYKIKDTSSNKGYTNVYCHMTSLPGCTGGGWTLVMKLNGKKETFNYDSSYWSNKASYNIGGGWTSFDDQETKLPTYWNTPFKEMCLGMKVHNDLNFISISYSASSLYDVIADGKYRATAIGRSKWLSLVQESDIQPNCNREGFNNLVGHRIRIGILANQENNCNSPDSYLGFGGTGKNIRGGCNVPKISNACGNVAYCMPSGRKVEIPAIGYIFVR